MLLMLIIAHWIAFMQGNSHTAQTTELQQYRMMRKIPLEPLAYQPSYYL